MDRYAFGWSDFRGMFTSPTPPADPYLLAGHDIDTYDTFCTVRLEFKDGELIDIKSAVKGFMPDPHKLEEKLSLLKISPVGTKIDKVGLRRAEDIFYLRFYEYELSLGE